MQPARSGLSRAGRVVTAAAALALALGLFVRVYRLGSKPFWRDEACVATLVERPQLETVNEDLVIPVAFLALVKATAPLARLVSPEVAYRLLPLAAGLAALALLPLLGRRLGAPASWPLTSLWLAAGLPGLVYYSRELKQYSLDLLIAIAAPLLVQALAGRGWRRPTFAVLLALVVVAPWVSFGSVLFLPAALTWQLWRKRRSADFWPLVAASVLFLVSLGVAYGTVLRVQAANPYLIETWQAEIRPPGLPGPLAVAEALWQPYATMMTFLFADAWPAAAVFIALGLAAWPPPGRRLLIWLLVVPAVAASGAALANRYLLSSGRLLLFLAPPLLLLVGAGLARAGEVSGGRRWAGPLAAATASLWWTSAAVWHRQYATQTEQRLFFRQDVLQDVEPAIALLDRQGVPGPSVFVARFTGFAFRYYSRGRLPGATVCTFAICRNEKETVLQWVTGLEGPGWMILTDEEEPILRRVLLRRGLDVRSQAAGRGMLLWTVSGSAAQPGPAER